MPPAPLDSNTSHTAAAMSSQGVSKNLRVGPFRTKIGASGTEFREESGGDGPGADVCTKMLHFAQISKVSKIKFPEIQNSKFEFCQNFKILKF